LDQEGRVLDRLAALQPNHPALFLLRGFRLQTQGRFSDAESEFLRAIEVQPHQGGAYHSITIGRKITEKDLPLVEQMERVAEAGGLPPNEAGPLHFALGKAYDDLGRPGQAMPQFIEGNRLTRVSLGLRPFDREALARDVERTMDLFTRDYFRENLRPHPYEPTPIVIAGAMRSGTTLVEQILSSHPHVAPAGEQVFWRRAAPDCVLYDPYDPEAGVMHEVIRRKSQEYVDHLRELAPGYEFVTDKEPANHRLFGLIRLALPNSPLIQLRRNLADVAVSMFTTHFQTGEEYVWDRDDIVFALKQHARLAAHWRKVMPRDRFLEVDYTALVTDPEPTIRRIVEFCGLDWDDACLHPEQNERRVNTPSFWQVRQPLNPGSVDRWRRYDGHLGPFAELVEL
jgi:tetratricopeptide (TPR) repeat protein